MTAHKTAFIDLHSLFGFPDLVQKRPDAFLNEANVGFIQSLNDKHYNVMFLCDTEELFDAAKFIADNTGANGVVLSPNYLREESFTEFAISQGADPKHSVFILGSREAVQHASDTERLSAISIKLNEPSALVKKKDLTPADRRDQEIFAKLPDRIHRFERYADDGVLYSLDLPRLLVMPPQQLVELMPERAINIVAHRSIFDGVVNILCRDKRKSRAVVPEIPDQIDYATCRRFEILETSNDILVRLYGEKPENNVLYQSVIAPEAWAEEKGIVFKAGRNLRKAMAMPRAE